MRPSTLCAALLWPALACAAAPLPPAAVESAASAAQPGEPNVQRSVIEDDGNRIEELRVRGQTERIVVRLKDGGRAYEILPANGGRDLSQDKRAIGQRVWSVLSF